MSNIGPFRFNPPPAPLSSAAPPPLAPPQPGASSANPSPLPGAIFQNPAVQNSTGLVFGKGFSGFPDLMLQQILRELLDMPKEIQALLQLFSGEIPPNQPVLPLLQRLMENPQLLLAWLPLQHQLAAQSQSALQKLLSQLQRMPVADKNHAEQLQILIQQMSAIQSAVNASPLHALQPVVLLYLPWYPLSPPQQFHFGQARQSDQSDQSDSASEASSLQIYLQTQSLGRFLIQVGEDGPLRLYLHFRHEPAATPSVKTIEKNVTESLSETGMLAPVCIFHCQETPHIESFQEEETAPAQEEPKQTYTLSPTGAIQTRIVLAAYTIIRVILEMDNTQTLLSIRARKIQS